MRHHVLIAITLAAALPGIQAAAQTTQPATQPATTQPADQPVISEKEKINALIEHVANLRDATFIRNDEEHTPAEAADHMRRKLESAGDRVETARQFIEEIASKSSMTDRPYLIRLADGTVVSSGEYLADVLRRIEAGEAGPDQPQTPETFNAEESDPKAIEIADAVMERLGGREAWEGTRFLTWKFFGMRQHVWDRQTGDIRVEFQPPQYTTPLLILMNIRTMKGKAWLDGKEVTEPEELDRMMKTGWGAWVNDSYWLIMPYKMKDPGVTLKYLGEKEMQDGRRADVVQITFADVGITPQNKYQVYVAKDSGLVEQWEFFRHFNDEEPLLTSPWREWKRYGEILLSGDRGSRKHTEIAVFDDLPRSVFEDPAPVNLREFGGHWGEPVDGNGDSDQ